VKLLVVLGIFAAGAAGVTAQAAAPLPHSVSSSVDKWTKTAVQIQDSKISLGVG
jgi:hypothetical protein